MPGPEDRDWGASARAARSVVGGQPKRKQMSPEEAEARQQAIMRQVEEDIRRSMGEDAYRRTKTPAELREMDAARERESDRYAEQASQEAQRLLESKLKDYRVSDAFEGADAADLMRQAREAKPFVEPGGLPMREARPLGMDRLRSGPESLADRYAREAERELRRSVPPAIDDVVRGGQIRANPRELEEDARRYRLEQQRQRPPTFRRETSTRPTKVEYVPKDDDDWPLDPMRALSDISGMDAALAKAMAEYEKRERSRFNDHYKTEQELGSRPTYEQAPDRYIEGRRLYRMTPRRDEYDGSWDSWKIPPDPIPMPDAESGLSEFDPDRRIYKL